MPPKVAALRLLLFTGARLSEILTLRWTYAFIPYEISNFAGRGGPCLHNDHYWLQGDYVGIGPGASSHRNGTRSTNLKTIGAWADCIDKGMIPVAQAETLSPRQRAGEAVWLGIRRRDGVDLEQVGERLDLPLLSTFAETIRGLEEEALVDWDGRRLKLNTRGLLFANTVGERFLA